MEEVKGCIHLADDQEDCKLQKMKCHVMLQKETADGLKDVCCGLETTAGCAGLCE